jgi:Bardet-Biedl syndrome 7 protein
MKDYVILIIFTGTVKDKIFVSSENEVRGYTKKGKLFLGFDTNLTEHIKSM